MLDEGDERYQIRPDFRYLHEPIADDHAAKWVIGRIGRAQELADRIMLSRGGAFLVSGLRGVGKTTCVRYAVHLIRQGRERFRRLGEDVELVDVWINLGRPLEPVQLLHHLIRHLYLRLKEMRLLERLEPSLRDDLQIAFLRTSFEISSRSLAGEESSRDAEIGVGTKGWLGLDFASKLSSSFKRSQSEEEALKYLPYDEKAAEFEILSLSRRLSNGTQQPEGRWRRWWQRIRHPRHAEVRAKVVFVLDELDKLEALKLEPNTSRLDPVLQALKGVFTSSGFSFVFIGGKELEEHLLQDLSLGDSIYESIFAFDLYLPCLWDEQRSIVLHCFEPDERDRVDKSTTLALYLRYKGRGVPRRIWRELNKFVFWDEQRPVLILDLPLRRYMDVFAKLEESLDGEEIFQGVRGVADFALIDRRRLCFYYTTDWILSRGNASFTVAQVQQLAETLNLGNAGDNEVVALVAETAVKLLLARTFIEPVGLEHTVINAVGAQRVFRLSPWVLRAFQGAGDKQFAPETTPAQSSDASQQLDRIGAYRVLDKIGEGGFAIIYRVIDAQGRVLAAKILRRDLAQRASRVVDLFKTEIAALHRLSHPGIVRVHDFGDEKGCPYLVMDLLQGSSLRQVLASVKSVEYGHACVLAVRLAEIFGYVHGCGLVRLDIKPSNVFLTTRNELKTVDFGIAIAKHAAGGNAGEDGALIGTPGYMSPEQVSRGQSDVRGDVYALGVVLCEMLTGPLPTASTKTIDVDVYAAGFRRTMSLLAQLTHVPAELGHVIRKALAEDPDQRFQTMAEFAAALLPFSSGELAYVVQELRGRVDASVASRDDRTMFGARPERQVPAPRSSDRFSTNMPPPGPAAAATTPSAPADCSEVDAASPRLAAETPVHLPPVSRPVVDRGQKLGSHSIEESVVQLRSSHSAAQVSAFEVLSKSDRERGGPSHLLFDLAKKFCLWNGLDGRVLKIPLSGGSLKLGRNASAVDLPLEDQWISRQHVAFFPSMEGVDLEDLSTANGTLLNGKRIRRERLTDGDTIEVGDRKIVVHILAAESTLITGPG